MARMARRSSTATPLRAGAAPARRPRSPQDLARTLIDTPAGRMPVSSIATVEETDGPNQIGRENGRRRIVVYANTDGGDMGRVIGDIRKVIDADALPTGNFISLEGQFQAQEQATR
jgi:Cu/Ag efflux pump CusA